MKKLFLLIVMCLVGLIVPQGVLADIEVYSSSTLTITKSDDGKTITIHSEKAGAFESLNFNGGNGGDIKAAFENTEKIVFDGEFCGEDLNHLKGGNGANAYNCCVQKIVDMSEAKFVKKNQQSHDTYLYHSESDRENKKELDRCIVGATKYKSAVRVLPSNWHEIGEDEIASGQSWQTRNVCADDVNTLNYSYDVYLKLPTTLNYYQLVVTTDEHNNETSRDWVQVQNLTDDQKSEAMEVDGQYSAANLDGLKNNYQPNQIVKVRPDDCTYKYYTNEATYEFYWQSVAGTGEDYQNGAKNTDQWYSDINEAPTPTDYGQWAIAGGTEYVFQHGQWVDPSSANLPNENDYDKMKFDLWKETITEAITSKYATGRLAPQLCNGCAKLETLTLNSGDFALNNTQLGSDVNKLKTVNIKSDVTSLSNGMFNGKNTITDVTFEDGDKNLSIGEGCFNMCTSITSLALPARLASMGKQAFANTMGVASLSLPENSRLTTIPEQAFKSCGNNTQAEFEITIPRSVTLIEDEGFGDMWRLKTVTFKGQSGDDPLLIKTGAFAGGSETNYTLSDVYVDIDPEVRRLICEYGAFSYTSMEGQTNVENLSELTTLHFKEDYWDYYAGDWKKGVTFDQDALNSFKDGCDPTKDPMNADYMIGTNDQIRSNNGHIPGKQPANGWQQFAKTSTNIDIIVPKGKFYRTYSTPIVLVKPDWMKIYRVKSFDDGYKEGDDVNSSAAAAAAERKAYTEELDFKVTVNGKDVYCIPSGTGVIRVDNREKEAIYYFLEWSDLDEAYQTGYNNNAESWEYPYEEKNVERINYLMPTLGNEVTIGPVEKEGNKITYRLFGLKKVTVSGVVPQFSRSKKNVKMGDHRAYLRLPASVFRWKNEKEGTIQDATEEAVVDDSNAKVSLIFDEIFEEMNGGITTEIKEAIDAEMYKNDSFYTIQGVKVAKPTTKGVYIRNGKKIYIK